MSQPTNEVKTSNTRRKYFPFLSHYLPRMCILQSKSDQCHLLHPQDIASEFFVCFVGFCFSWQRDLFRDKIRSENSPHQYVFLPSKQKQL